jgi:hypothetical protein
VVDNGEGRVPRSERPGPTPTTTATMLPDQGDPRRIGELLAAWVGAKLAEVDDLVDEARSRVDALPDQRVLWSLVGEVIVLLRALELEVADLKRGRR